MAKIASSNFWKTLLGIITGSIVGTLLGELVSDIRGLSWLSFGKSVGVNPPFSVDLGFLTFTFGITLSVNLAIVFCIVLFVLLLRKLL